MILGLTGSFGSGKSTVAEIISELTGAPVIDADAIVKDLQQPGKPGLTAIVREFGEEYLQPDGSLNRRKLAKLVFQDNAQLDRLNAIIHPLVQEEERQMLHDFRKEPLVVFMVPLLFEVGHHQLCDKVAVVAVAKEVRYERLQQRDGLAPAEVDKRLASQMSQEEKIRRADRVINNSGTLTLTRFQVKQMLTDWNLWTPDEDDR